MVLQACPTTRGLPLRAISTSWSTPPLTYGLAGLPHHQGVAAEGHQHQLVDRTLLLGDELAVADILRNAACKR